MKWIKRALWTVIVIVVLLIVGTYAINLHMARQSSSQIFTPGDDISEAQTALVLGARVYSNGMMSDMFHDRVATAAELYKAGKVKKILVSGDHSRKDYDEVNAAKNYLLEQGMPGEDIFLDHAGLDTYDSLYRAKHIFKVESIVIISQKFHLPRAIYIAKKLEIKANGLIADKREYQKIGYSQRREIMAKDKAFLNILFHSEPQYMGEVIPITGDSRLSWD